MRCRVRPIEYALTTHCVHVNNSPTHSKIHSNKNILSSSPSMNRLTFSVQSKRANDFCSIFIERLLLDFVVPVHWRNGNIPICKSCGWRKNTFSPKKYMYLSFIELWLLLWMIQSGSTAGTPLHWRWIVEFPHAMPNTINYKVNKHIEPGCTVVVDRLVDPSVGRLRDLIRYRNGNVKCCEMHKRKTRSRHNRIRPVIIIIIIIYCYCVIILLNVWTAWIIVKQKKFSILQRVNRHRL